MNREACLAKRDSVKKVGQWSSHENHSAHFSIGYTAPLLHGETQDMYRFVILHPTFASPLLGHKQMYAHSHAHIYAHAHWSIMACIVNYVDTLFMSSGNACELSIQQSWMRTYAINSLAAMWHYPFCCNRGVRVSNENNPPAGLAYPIPTYKRPYLPFRFASNTTISCRSRIIRDNHLAAGLKPWHSVAKYVIVYTFEVVLWKMFRLL